MTRTRFVLPLSLSVFAILAACGKSNKIEQSHTNSTFVGQECFGYAEGECADGLSCVAGFCRESCETDADCPGGVCLSDGIFSGCRLPEEGSCGPAKKCPGNLICGLDKACRSPCGAGAPCANGGVCIAETCVGPDEPGAQETWFSCTPGDRVCEGEVVRICDGVAPGWAELRTCMKPEHCVGGQCAFDEPPDAGPDSPPDAPDEAGEPDAVAPDAESDAAQDAEPDAPADGPPDVVEEEAAPTCDAPKSWCGSLCTNLNDDDANCGTCGHKCPSGPHSTAACVAKTCELHCSALWGDCNLTPSDGCETSLTTDDSCGFCDQPCSPAEACSASGVCGADPNKPVAISAGWQHACVLTASGTVRCWGLNDVGQLGSGAGTSQARPVDVPGLSGVAQVVAGARTTCVRLESGSVACWGGNGSGEAGVSGASTVSSPTNVSGISDATWVDVGGCDGGAAHACAVVGGGHVVCWGSNASGELGNGTQTPSPSPVTVSGVSDAAEVRVACSHSCARRTNGHVVCWGAGTQGQLGQGTSADSLTPVDVTGLVDAAELGLASKASANRSCARRQNGVVVCWGLFSEVGINSANSPTAVGGFSQASRFAVGGAELCMAKTDSTVWCAGSNASGQLADTTTTDRASATQAKWMLPGTLNGATSVTVGGAFASVLRSDGSVFSAGDATNGALGDNQRIPGANRSPMVQLVQSKPPLTEAGMCFDERDNDGDLGLDGEDPDCAANLGSALASPAATFTMKASMGNYLRGSCGGDGREQVYLWQAPSTGNFQFATGGSSFATVVYVIDGVSGGPELGCNANGTTSQVQTPLQSGQRVLIVVDSTSTSASGTGVIQTKKL